MAGSKKISNTSIFLEDNFRKQLIEGAIKKAGSMRQLGRIMGYSGNSPNWSIKQILYGNQGIPLHRMQKLCAFIGISWKDVEKNVRNIRR
jgi:hypothetical protein